MPWWEQWAPSLGGAPEHGFLVGTPRLLQEGSKHHGAEMCRGCGVSEVTSHPHIFFAWSYLTLWVSVYLSVKWVNEDLNHQGFEDDCWCTACKRV